MGQLNIPLSDAFEEELSRFMALRGIKDRFEAIRTAVHEGLKGELAKEKKSDFRAWLGAGNGPGLNPNPRFKTDDDLWEKD